VTHPITIIGLGVMGQRMLTNMHQYQGFEALAAWDPSEDARRLTAERYPGVRIAHDAADAIGDRRTTAVYVASPPTAHEPHAVAAIEAGKAVWCEKPLGVDIATSERLVATAQAAGVVNMVNFSLASATATREVERCLGEGALGELAGIDIRIHFSKWPREWQLGAASWLSYRAEGGFTREVVSHWIYLTERLFGPLRLLHHAARYPAGDLAESHVHAGLETRDAVPVSVAGSIGGAGPDLVEYTIWGSRASYRIHDWNRLRSASGAEWRDELSDIPDPREAGYQLQLANAAQAAAGQPHSMPDFRQALSVQRLIEAMLEA
jgi:predicted dehydrogenase